MLRLFLIHSPPFFIHLCRSEMQRIRDNLIKIHIGCLNVGCSKWITYINILSLFIVSTLKLVDGYNFLVISSVSIWFYNLCPCLMNSFIGRPLNNILIKSCNKTTIMSHNLSQSIIPSSFPDFTKNFLNRFQEFFIIDRFCKRYSLHTKRTCMNLIK